MREIWVAGCPSYVGGADTELYHQIILWRKAGVLLDEEGAPALELDVEDGTTALISKTPAGRSEWPTHPFARKTKSPSHHYRCWTTTLTN